MIYAVIAGVTRVRPRTVAAPEPFVSRPRHRTEHRDSPASVGVGVGVGSIC